MADLPSELRTLVERYGAHVLDDADGLRATLADFLDDDSSPGDVNLSVDAVRFGALERLRTLLNQGADPSAALTDVAEGLAQRRGGDAESAYWACAVLGYAADLLPADLIPRRGERPTSFLPATTTSASLPLPSDSGAEATNIVGQTGAAAFDEAHVNRPPGGKSGTDERPGEAESPSSGRTISRGKLVLFGAVAAFAIAGGVAVAVAMTQSTSSDEPKKMQSTSSPGHMDPDMVGHDVPITKVTKDNIFGHFGSPGVMNKVLESPCSDSAPPNAKFTEYTCNFKEDPDFYIKFSDGDPLIKDQHEVLPPDIIAPGHDTIVTLQPEEEKTKSLHASVMTFIGSGADGIRDTDDDLVKLVLYDVAKEHPGSATFESSKLNSEPLTRSKANDLLSEVGAPEDKFPLPQPFKKSTLGSFARRFLTARQLGLCREGFTHRGELEHVTCFEAKDPEDSTVTINFELGKLAQAQKKNSAPGSSSSSWHLGRDEGKIVTYTYAGKAWLFWYSTPSTTGGEVPWGVLSAKTQQHGASGLISTFRRFKDHPKVT